MTNTSFPGSGIKLIRSDLLPDRTMLVSPDLYDLIANDGAVAKKNHAESLSKIEELSALLAKVKP